MRLSETLRVILFIKSLVSYQKVCIDSKCIARLLTVQCIE